MFFVNNGPEFFLLSHFSVLQITLFRKNGYREFYYGLSETIEQTMETLIERLKESEKEGLLPSQQQTMMMTIHNPAVPPALFPSMVRYRNTWAQLRLFALSHS